MTFFLWASLRYKLQSNQVVFLYRRNTFSKTNFEWLSHKQQIPGKSFSFMLKKAHILDLKYLEELYFYFYSITLQEMRFTHPILSCIIVVGLSTGNHEIQI